jgi:hypothetical protein
MWRILRISVLLFVLAVAVYSTLYDRLSTTDWDQTLWVGVFPVAADDSPATRAYLDRLGAARVAEIEQFLNREARRHGVHIARPVRIELYAEVREHPPALEPGAGALARMWWSIELRLYARRNARPEGRPAPQVRVFVLHHDPASTAEVPHSVGLQKGLVGVVHAYAEDDMARPNNVVIAHEILHTLGASDKYDPVTLAPLYPAGYAEPGREPRHPQVLTELMAGRYAVDSQTFEMPDSLAEVRIGDATALEIGWTPQP